MPPPPSGDSEDNANQPTGTRGRGAPMDPANRYHLTHSETIDDGWYQEPLTPPRTHLGIDHSRKVISYNRSPDVPFDRSINPYRGCEHGCIYCYARPTHAWLDLSPGLDFETRILHKPDAAAQLRAALCAPNYQVAPIAVGANTDAYQPLERGLGLTRSIIEVLAEFHHPLLLVSKSALVERDIDLLAPMASAGLAQVALSVTSLDAHLSRRLEPRANAPQRRLSAIRRLAEAGIAPHVLVAPIIPMLNDAEIEDILGACREAGAVSAAYVLIRLPLEVAPLFEAWLTMHYPDRAKRVLERIRDCRQGQLYQADFATRRIGSGDYARVIAQRFRLATRKLGYRAPAELRCDLFQRPGQMALF